MALASSDTAALHAWSPWGWPVYLPPGHSRSKSNSTLLLPSGPTLMEAGRCSQVGWLRPGSPCPYSERTRWVLGLLSWHKKKNHQMSCSSLRVITGLSVLNCVHSVTANEMHYSKDLYCIFPQLLGIFKCCLLSAWTSFLPDSLHKVCTCLLRICF